MPLTVWTREKDNVSLLSILELDVGQYDFYFDSNILTRNTILLVAQLQKDPIEVRGHILRVISATDDGKTITIIMDSSKGDLPDTYEAGFGKASIFVALGALGLVAGLYLSKVNFRKSITGAASTIADALSEILFKPGIVLVLIFGLIVIIYLKAKG